MKNLIDLIQTKWPAEVTVSVIILHKTYSRKNIRINKIDDEIKQKAHQWNVKFLDNTIVVTLATGHIDPEAYFYTLNNEKRTKKFANNIKFALGLKFRTYPNKRGDQRHTKQIDNISNPIFLIKALQDQKKELPMPKNYTISINPNNKPVDALF